MARRMEKKTQSLAVLAGLIVFLLGAGFANADVRGAVVDAIVEAEEPAPAPAAPQGDDAAAGQSPVVGALEADHAAPVEEEAKLEEEPEEVDEEPDDPDPDADPPDDQTTVGAVPPPAPAADDDDDTDEADDADTADDEDEQTQEGDESADEDD